MRLAPTLLLLPLATAAPTSPLERRQTLPVGDQIQIQSVTVAGNGCPPGTFTSQVSLDRTAVTLGFDQFAAELTPASDRDKTCAVVVQARYPVGCITAVVENTQHGFAELPAAVVGSLQAAYAVTPGRIVGSAASQTSLSGAAYVFGQPWLKTDRISTAVSATSTSRDVFMVVNFRDLLTTSGGATLASLRTDDMTIAFTDQRRSSGQWVGSQVMTKGAQPHVLKQILSPDVQHRRPRVLDAEPSQYHVVQVPVVALPRPHPVERRDVKHLGPLRRPPPPGDPQRPPRHGVQRKRRLLPKQHHVRLVRAPEPAVALVLHHGRDEGVARRRLAARLAAPAHGDGQRVGRLVHRVVLVARPGQERNPLQGRQVAPHARPVRRRRVRAQVPAHAAVRVQPAQHPPRVHGVVRVHGAVAVPKDEKVLFDRRVAVAERPLHLGAARKELARHRDGLVHRRHTRLGVVGVVELLLLLLAPAAHQPEILYPLPKAREPRVAPVRHQGDPATGAQEDARVVGALVDLQQLQRGPGRIVAGIAPGLGRLDGQRDGEGDAGQLAAAVDGRVARELGKPSERVGRRRVLLRHHDVRVPLGRVRQHVWVDGAAAAEHEPREGPLGLLQACPRRFGCPDRVQGPRRRDDDVRLRDRLRCAIKGINRRQQIAELFGRRLRGDHLSCVGRRMRFFFMSLRDCGCCCCSPCCGNVAAVVCLNVLCYSCVLEIRPRAPFRRHRVCP
ncbi:hypothetical protein M9X92_001558 [Pyricularia oryzae]|nr:hypothetical protein M9X92_001558 [Pyricularia oryzae]